MKCPECGGTLYYSIEQRKLVCEHCGQTFSPDQYRNNNAAMDEDWGGAHTYHCRSCGAELLAMNDEAVVYCPYCGSEAILEGELQGMNRPKQLIPFSISKEACKRIYQKELKNKLYLPKEFKDPEFIERFRPFYIPYWMYRVKFRDEPFDAIGYKDYTSLGYDYHEEYEVRAEIKEKGLYGVPYDASRNFDDTIAENIAPFRKKELKPFRPGYLAGMYADRPNVDPEVYREDVLERAAVSAVEDIKNGLGGIVLKLPKGKKLQTFLDSRYEGAEAVFLPVWFLTWRKGDRVAYAVVNGQTGIIHIDLPTDLRSFMLRTVIAAGLLFALLTLFVSVTSRFVLWFSALLVYIAGRRYRDELREIRDRENHVFDKGYLLMDDDELEMSERARARVRRRSRPSILKTIRGGLWLMTVCFAGVFGVIGMLGDLFMTYEAAIALTFLIVILETVLFLQSVNIVRHLRNKRSMIALIAALASVIYSFVIAGQMPVMDWWYYLGSLLCLASASIMCIDLIARYNETATRALPSFYTREGGNDHA